MRHGFQHEASMSEEKWRKLKVPLFSGEDAFRWLNRVDQYFQMKRVKEKERLQVIMMAMEGIDKYLNTWGTLP